MFQVGYCFQRIFGAEHKITGNQHVGACIYQFLNISRRYSPINLYFS